MMELLNNIWMALSTPNELLINIILICVGFLENYLTLHLITAILNIKPTFKQQLIYLTLIIIMSLLSSNLISSPFNIFLNYGIMISLVLTIFKLSPLKSIFATLSSALIYTLVGTLTLNPYMTLFNISYEQLEIIPIHRLLYVLLLCSIVSLIIIFFKKKKINLNLKLLDDINKKTKSIIFINFALGILTLIIQIIILFYYINTLPLSVTFLSSISLLAYFSLNIYSLTRVTKLNLTTKKLESSEEYNKTLRVLHDNVRGFKHDFDNIVTTIGGYVKTNDMEGLKNYYIQLEDDCQKVNNLYLLNPEIINNPGIYNLLTNKYYDAESKDIKVNMTFLLDLNTLKMKIYEFARILGILLDNAIEASEECNEKIINITFRNDDKNNRQLIIIENTYSNKDVDTEKIFGKGISEKENHTGLGLWEVQNIIKKNNNINLYTSKNNKFFIQQLEIY